MKTFEDFLKEQDVLSEDELFIMAEVVTIISTVTELRKDKGWTRKQLEEYSGVKQNMIARIENGTTKPDISILIKILKPLDYTLAVVPLQKEQPL